MWLWSTAAILIFTGVGERSREGNDLWGEMRSPACPTRRRWFSGR